MHFAGHAEMQTEQIVAGEFEEDLFAAGGRPQQSVTDNLTSESACICLAKDAFLRVKPDINDPLSEAWVPLFAIPFDLGQFRHGRRVKNRWEQRKGGIGGGVNPVKID
ncbi:MAG: hypothetical protein QOH39_656 [Verrucomicrobiota bacterium]|jgi:hypothetical protein